MKIYTYVNKLFVQEISHHCSYLKHKIKQCIVLIVLFRCTSASHYDLDNFNIKTYIRFLRHTPFSLTGTIVKTIFNNNSKLTNNTVLLMVFTNVE